MASCSKSSSSDAFAAMSAGRQVVQAAISAAVG
jgi:hypothetical protein